MKQELQNETLLIKNGSELDSSEVSQISASLFREFKVTTTPEKLKDKLFFLLKNGPTILAMGGLWKVKPFVLQNTNYTIYGVVEVVANQKRQGFGKRVMTAMREFIVTHDVTGFGFCMPKNQEFYKKCGFQIATGITQRFIFRKDGKDITNQDGQIIFYQDSSDLFMKKVLENQSEEISIPTQELW